MKLPQELMNMSIYIKQKANPGKLDTTPPNPKRLGLNKKNLDGSDFRLSLGKESQGGNNFKLDLVDPLEAADILDIKLQTLANWRITKSQPLSYYKIGRSVKYNRHDLLTFIRNRCVAVDTYDD